jgi:hypothetical protein
MKLRLIDEHPLAVLFFSFVAFVFAICIGSTIWESKHPVFDRITTPHTAFVTKENTERNYGSRISFRDCATGRRLEVAGEFVVTEHVASPRSCKDN